MHIYARVYMYHFVNRLCHSKVINMRTSTHTHIVICQPCTLQAYSNKYNAALAQQKKLRNSEQRTHTTNSKIHVEHTHTCIRFVINICIHTLARSLSLTRTQKPTCQRECIYIFLEFLLAIYHTLKPCAICAHFKNAQRTSSQVQ